MKERRTAESKEAIYILQSGGLACMHRNDTARGSLEPSRNWTYSNLEHIEIFVEGEKSTQKKIFSIGTVQATFSRRLVSSRKWYRLIDSAIVRPPRKPDFKSFHSQAPEKRKAQVFVSTIFWTTFQ